MPMSGNEGTESSNEQPRYRMNDFLLRSKIRERIRDELIITTGV